MIQRNIPRRGRLHLYLIAAGVAWGLLDLAARGLLAPLHLPSKSVFLVPLGIFILAAARARTGLAGSCLLMGIGAALARTAILTVGRCPTGYFCYPVGMIAEALSVEIAFALARVQTRQTRLAWGAAGALGGALSPALFAVVGISAFGMPGGWSNLGDFLALRAPMCLVGGALAAVAGVKVAALGRARVPCPDKAA